VRGGQTATTPATAVSSKPSVREHRQNCHRSRRALAGTVQGVRCAYNDSVNASILALHTGDIGSVHHLFQARERRLRRADELWRMVGDVKRLAALELSI
jgi:hypothetical protein